MSIIFVYNKPCIKCGKIIVKSRSGKCKFCVRKGVKFSKQHCKNISKGKTGSKTAERFNKERSLRIKGENNPNYRGGLYTTKEGYRSILSSEHSYRDKRGYVLEHRLIMEKYIGRYLKLEEVVHHRNKKKDDNRIKNLKLFKNESEHQKWHRLYD